MVVYDLLNKVAVMGMDWINPIQSNPVHVLDWIGLDWVGLDWIGFLTITTMK